MKDTDYENVEDDRGPWQIDVWKQDGKQTVVLQSQDSYDVALEISGNFSCFAQKLEYAHKLAKRMNSMDGTRPVNWRQLEREKEENGKASGN